MNKILLRLNKAFLTKSINLGKIKTQFKFGSKDKYLSFFLIFNVDSS